MMITRLRRAWRATGAPSPEETLAALIEEGVVIWGDHSYGVPDVHVWRSPIVGRVGGRVSVGRYCSIAAGVHILTDGNHRIDWLSTFPFRTVWDLPDRDRDGFPDLSTDITIGNDVWVGFGATILPGAQIGDGAVVGAGAIVATSLRPYAVAVGSPAKEIKRRFTDTEIETLLQVRWWDWPEDKIRRNIGILCGNRVDSIVKAV